MNDTTSSNIVCFTGHRTIKGAALRELPERLEEALIELIQSGYTVFRAGGALGFDTMVATEVLNLQRKLYPSMKLILAIPCVGQEDRWTPIQKALYKQIRQLANGEFVLSSHYYNGCMHKRNDFMVEHSSHLIAFVKRSEGGSAYTLRTAQKKGLSICNLAEKIYHTQLDFFAEQGQFENI